MLIIRSNWFLLLWSVSLTIPDHTCKMSCLYMLTFPMFICFVFFIHVFAIFKENVKMDEILLFSIIITSELFRVAWLSKNIIIRHRDIALGIKFFSLFHMHVHLLLLYSKCHLENNCKNGWNFAFFNNYYIWAIQGCPVIK